MQTRANAFILLPALMLRSILLALSQSPRVARFVTRNNVSRRVVRRFVAGEHLDDAVAAVRALNHAGRLASLDCLGESVATEEEARRAAAAYSGMFDRIAAEKLTCNVSLKLTQLGLDTSQPLCEELLAEIVNRAAAQGNFVRIDMESSAYTGRTIDICKRVRAKTDSVGTVLQSYLFRTEQDARDLVASGCRLRLVKGAYKEPPSVAFPQKSDVDANYIKVMKVLLASGIYHGIATHDPRMLEATKKFASEKGIRTEQFEFQMLYGIRTDLQEQLIREGYRLRVYVPYGSDWFPYFMRRLAERPANLKFFLSNLFRSG
ncbi:MAG: proline dehydrogenase family protein [Candidatus Acidiferrales bacterium]